MGKLSCHCLLALAYPCAPSDYLIRAEVIALHVASSVGGAQLYVSFEVTSPPP